MKKIWKILSLIALFTICCILSVKIIPQEEYEKAKSGRTFDATEQVDLFFAEILPGMVENAAPVGEVLSALARDPRQAASEYGRTLGIGAPYSMAVKGEGTVKAADGETITLAEDGITLRTSMIFGNSVREASGFFGIDDYENTMDFNLISSDINSRLEESFAGHGFVPGQKVRYAGVMDVDPRKPLPSAFEVIPVKLETE